MNLKWIEKDDEVLDRYYSLRDNHDNEIAYMWFYDGCWSLIPTLSILQEILGKKFYRTYEENEIKKVEFHAILDIQSALNEIGNICFNYSNDISDYITKYLKELNNED